MKINNNTFVSLIYELRENDNEGRVIETVTSERPLSFVFGSGNLLPTFEENIVNLQKGDGFRFHLVADQAYGERREDMIIDIPISVFLKDGVIDENICRVGNEVPMMDRDGNRINGTINEITDTSVKMDFNHPMAGTNLYFTGTVTEVREATDLELNPPSHSCSSCGSHGDESGCSGGCS